MAVAYIRCFIFSPNRRPNFLRSAPNIHAPNIVCDMHFYILECIWEISILDCNSIKELLKANRAHRWKCSLAKRIYKSYSVVLTACRALPNMHFVWLWFCQYLSNESNEHSNETKIQKLMQIWCASFSWSSLWSHVLTLFRNGFVRVYIVCGLAFLLTNVGNIM